MKTSNPMSEMVTTLKNAATLTGLVCWLLVADLAMRVGLPVGVEEIKSVQDRVEKLTAK